MQVQYTFNSIGAQFIFKFSGKGDIKLASDFNVPIINVLWQIVAGDRFDLNKPRDASLMAGVRGVFNNNNKSAAMTMGQQLSHP